MRRRPRSSDQPQVVDFTNCTSSAPSRYWRRDAVRCSPRARNSSRLLHVDEFPSGQEDSFKMCKLAVLVFKCVHGFAPPYLADELCRPADFQARFRLRSATSSILVWLSVELALRPWVIGHFRSLCHAYGTIFHSTPSRHLPSIESLKLSEDLFMFSFFSLISISTYSFLWSVCELTFVILDTLIVTYMY